MVIPHVTPRTIEPFCFWSYIQIYCLIFNIYYIVYSTHIGNIDSSEAWQLDILQLNSFGYGTGNGPSLGTCKRNCHRTKTVTSHEDRASGFFPTGTAWLIKSLAKDPIETRCSGKRNKQFSHPAKDFSINLLCKYNFKLCPSNVKNTCHLSTVNLKSICLISCKSVRVSSHAI